MTDTELLSTLQRYFAPFEVGDMSKRERAAEQPRLVAEIESRGGRVRGNLVEYCVKDGEVLQRVAW